MAKRDWFELWDRDFEFIRRNKNWLIQKDLIYYYKTLQEQNDCALGPNMAFNLEYMMDKKNYVSAINPVADIYYAKGQLITYRTKIVEGFSILELMEVWSPLNLSLWLPFYESMCDNLFESSKKDYRFPDLFTNGNILYHPQTQKCTFIDNDGIQVGRHYTGNRDSYADSFLAICMNSPSALWQKYFISPQEGFTTEWAVLAFYHWFCMDFLKIDLIGLLKEKNGFQLFYDALKKEYFPIHSAFFEHFSILFDRNEKNVLDKRDFRFLIENYNIIRNGKKRILIPK